MAFTGAVEAAQKSGNTTGISPTAQAVTNTGNYGNTGGVNVSPLIQNLLNYKTGQPFDNQKNYTSQPVTMKTTATGTNYGVPIGPVKPGTQTTGGLETRFSSLSSSSLSRSAIRSLFSSCSHRISYSRAISSASS